MVDSQRTVAGQVEIEGVGLHSGARAAIRILPAAAASGIVFIRRDRGGAEIPARYRYLQDSSFATTLATGTASVATVEHLLAALHGLGIDNARIEMDGPEVPILDGSAAPFVRGIQAVGLQRLGAPRRYLNLLRPVSVKDGDKELLALPSNELEATYAIDFPHPAIGRQTVSACIHEESFIHSIAAARTFCMLKDVEAMQRAGLALGGSLSNAVVVGENGILNDSLRFPDEFVRHKVLDLVGDLALLGAPLRAHVIGFKGGHRLHASLIGRILADASSWTLGTADERVPAATIALFSHMGGRLIPRSEALTA